MKTGVVVFRSEKAGVKDVRMKYDAAAFHFTSEKIETPDEECGVRGARLSTVCN